MTDALTAIPFMDAIEAPLRACIKAQEMTDQQMRRVLEDELLEKDRKGSLRPVMMTFELQVDGQVHLLRIPLLSLVPVPFLQLEDIRFSYQLRITTFKKDVFSVKYSNSNALYTEEERLASKLDICIHAGVADMSMGLAKLYQMLDNDFTIIESHAV